MPISDRKGLRLPQAAAGRGLALVVVCALLSGCPSASNPTAPQQQPPQPPSSSPPSSPGASGPSAPPSSSSAGAPSSPSSPSSQQSSSQQSAGTDDGMPTDATNQSSASEPTLADTDSGGSESMTDSAVDMESSTAAEDSLPDLRDEESLDEALAQFEAAMEQAGRAAGDGNAQGNMSTSGAVSEQQGGAQGGFDGRDKGLAGGGRGPASQAGGDIAMEAGRGGTPPGGLPDTGNAGDSIPAGSSSGGAAALPPSIADQVAILDRQLESGTSEFDRMILGERETLKRTAGQGGSSAPATGGGAGSGGNEPEGGGSYGRPMPVGGGAGGALPDIAANGDPQIPQDVPRFPPPEDIPSGNDDDVVARQLREAAMREPDPELREALWDEYRKYKGIKK